jgi:chromosome partitioning protein
VAPAHFRRVLKANPDLPQGLSETEGGAKWFTLDEVLRLRAHFGAEGSKSKHYLPYRPAGLPAKLVAVANFKGGVGKTSTAAHLAMSAALDGYRVLVIDLDSQASMTSVFGGRVADEWQTVFPLLARHYAAHLRADNRRRLDRGEPPVPLDATLTEALGVKAEALIQKTHWPNIDLIGAQLNLYWAEFQIPVWRMQALKSWPLWDALDRRCFRTTGCWTEYDLDLSGYAARAWLSDHQFGLAAADILLVPLGASFLEFDSTGRFFDMLLHHLPPRSRRGRTCAAPHRWACPRCAFQWDAVRAVVTRYDANAAGRTRGAMSSRPTFGRTLHRPPTGRSSRRWSARRANSVQGHLRGRLPRLQPRHLSARGREAFDRHLRRLQGAAAGAPGGGTSWPRRRRPNERAGPDPGRSDPVRSGPARATPAGSARAPSARARPCPGPADGGPPLPPRSLPPGAPVSGPVNHLLAGSALPPTRKAFPMAKRKRLTPAPAGRPALGFVDEDDPVPAGLETKSMFPRYPDGVARHAPPRPAALPPIAQVAGEAAGVAAFAEVAQTLADARSEGRLILRLPLAAVEEDYLVRDRVLAEDEEMQALLASLRARGQQAAIEVADLGQGRWGLISGWRRLTALRRLEAEGAGPGTVLAIARRPTEAAEAYLAMVEENEIRVGLSYYERARIVLRAVEKRVYASDKAGLQALFAAASRAKRSKIGSFLRIVRALDAHLRFPAALGERAGLALAAALDRDPDLERG